jgi:hypothetical protein
VRPRSGGFCPAWLLSSASHLEQVKQDYEADLKNGSAGVPLPNALARKYPNAAKDWGWYWIFPASRLYVDPRSGLNWSGLFYQYTNRLAYQFYFQSLNGLQSSLVFLYFTNAVDMDGPATEEEWHGASRLIHAVLGLPVDLSSFGVYHAFVDARQLADAAA